MPRIYYNNTDYAQQQILFVIHSFIYAVAMLAGWTNATPTTFWITIFWTALLVYHRYWRSPLDTGMQIRTYNRLRNRLGADWDLAATTEEFDLERQKAEIEVHLTHVLPDAGWVAFVIGIVQIMVLLVRSPLSFDLLFSAGLGLMLTVSLLQFTLRRQLRDTIRKANTEKAYRATAPIQPSVKVTHHPGKTYAIGDDGELIETQRKTSKG